MAEALFSIDFGACNLKCFWLNDKKVFGVRLPNAICYSKNKDEPFKKF